MKDAIFKDVLNIIDVSVVVIDEAGFIFFHNRQWESLAPHFTLKNGNYFEQLSHVQPPHAIDCIRQLLSPLLMGKTDSVSFDFPCLSTSDGAWLCLKAQVITREDRQYYMLQHDDITEKKEYCQQVDQLTLIDKLTGLANKKHFDDFYIHQWQRSMRNSAQLSLIITEFNCAIADIAEVSSVALIYKEHARRACDLAGITHPKKIALILGQTSLESATLIASVIEQRLLPLSERNEFSMKIGVSTAMPTLIDTPQVLLQAAEKALTTVIDTSASCVSNYNTTIIVKEEMA